VKKYSDSADSYTDPASGILRNKLGISSAKRLERAEMAASALREEELQRHPVQGTFDLPHLQAIHKRLFSDIYDWAGKIRTVNLSKGSTRFANYSFIEKEFERLAASLASENNLRGLSPAPFSSRTAHYMGEMNIIHPFREGNGRSLRVFIGQLAKEAGYKIQWEGMTQKDMLQAVIAAYQGSSNLLARLVQQNLVTQQ